MHKAPALQGLVRVYCMQMCCSHYDLLPKGNKGVYGSNQIEEVRAFNHQYQCPMGLNMKQLPIKCYIKN